MFRGHTRPVSSAELFPWLLEREGRGICFLCFKDLVGPKVRCSKVESLGVPFL
jgi:hypothetical protein